MRVAKVKLPFWVRVREQLANVRRFIPGNPVKISKRGLAFRHTIFRDAYAREFTIDYYALERELQPLEQGQADGAARIPPAAAQRPDAFEERLLTRVERTLDEAVSDRIHVVGRIQKELQAQRIVDPSSEMKTRKSNAIRVEMARRVKAGISQLLDLTDQRVAKQAAYLLFKQQNGRLTDARTQSPLLLGAGLFLLALTEATANYAFLVDTTDRLGDDAPSKDALLFMVLVMALLNIGPAFVCGWLLKYKNLTLQSAPWRQFFTKVFALSGAAAMAGVIGLMNLGYSWLRVLMEKLGGGMTFSNVGAMADQIAANPMGFTSNLYAVLFGCVGLVFASVAILHMYHHNDTYPNYGATKQSLDAAVRAFHKANTAVTARLTMVYESARLSIAKVVVRLENRVQEYRQVAHDYQVLRLIHDSERAKAGNIMRRILTVYRQANVQTRAGVPAPYYFRLPLTLPPAAGFNIADVRAELEQVEKVYAGAVTLQTTLNEELSKAQDDYRALLDKQLQDHLGHSVSYYAAAHPKIDRKQLHELDF